MQLFLWEKDRRLKLMYKFKYIAYNTAASHYSSTSPEILIESKSDEKPWGRGRGLERNEEGEIEKPPC